MIGDEKRRYCDHCQLHVHQTEFVGELLERLNPLRAPRTEYHKVFGPE